MDQSLALLTGLDREATKLFFSSGSYRVEVDNQQRTSYISDYLSFIPMCLFTRNSPLDAVSPTQISESLNFSLFPEQFLCVFVN